MNDFNGLKLNLGDKVICTMPTNGNGTRYSNFIRGIIIAFTPKNIRIEYPGECNSSLTILKHPSAVAKYEWRDSQ